MSLLSTNDYKTLREALLHHEEKSLLRASRDISVKATTIPVGEPWDVDMVLRIQMERNHIIQIQNFRTVEAAKQQIDSWEKRRHKLPL